MTYRKLFGIVTVLFVLVIYLWPMSLGSKIPEENALVITWTELDILPPVEGEAHSTLHNVSTTYRLEPGTEERDAFQNILDGYAIHRTWRTPFPATGLNGHSNGGYLLITWTEDEQFVHSIVTGFDRLLMVEDHIFGLGYLNKQLSQDMKEQVLTFLGDCPPLNAS